MVIQQEEECTYSMDVNGLFACCAGTVQMLIWTLNYLDLQGEPS